MIPAGTAIAHPDKLYIGGEWVSAHSGRLIDVVSPDSEAIVA